MQDILEREVNKRLTGDKGYANLDKLPNDWASYETQETLSKEGTPSEITISTIAIQKGRDITSANNDLEKMQPKLLKKGLQTKALSPDTVTVEKYEKMTKVEFEE